MSMGAVAYALEKKPKHTCIICDFYLRHIGIYYLCSTMYFYINFIRKKKKIVLFVLD